MDLGELRKLTFTIANKDQKGNTFSPEQFNLVLQSENFNLFEIEYEKLKKLALEQNRPFIEIFNNTTSLRIFKRVVNIGEDVIAGEVVFPKSSLPDFGYILSGLVNYNGAYRDLDFVDNIEASRRRTSVLTKSLEYYPIAVEEFNRFSLYPNDIKILEIAYLKKPDEPYYDYCIRNDNEREEYMPVGSYIKDTDNKLYDSGDNVLLGGQTVTHIDSPTLPYTSVSVELEWEDLQHLKLAGLILTKIGVKNDQDLLLQYSLREEQKQGT